MMKITQDDRNNFEKETTARFRSGISECFECVTVCSREGVSFYEGGITGFSVSNNT